MPLPISIHRFSFSERSVSTSKMNRFKLLILSTLLMISGTSATWLAYEEYISSLRSPAECERPSISFHRNQPWSPMQDSPPRHKTCQVKSHDNMETDDSNYILEALHQCNNGGRIVFPLGRTYVIGKPLDMQFLKHVDIGKSGQTVLYHFI